MTVVLDTKGDMKGGVLPVSRSSIDYKIIIPTIKVYRNVKKNKKRVLLPLRAFGQPHLDIDMISLFYFATVFIRP